MLVANRPSSIPAFRPTPNRSVDSTTATEKYMGSSTSQNLGATLKGAAYYGCAALLAQHYGNPGIASAAGLGTFVSFAEGTRVNRDASQGVALAAVNLVPTLVAASIGQHLGVGGVVACTVVGGVVGACLL